MTTLRIGTRGSQLALYQANTTAALLRERTGTPTEIVVIRTSGDRLAEASLSEIGGKRLFVKEIEDALLAGSVDLAVHSSKDMPAVLPDGLDIAAVLPREDPRDAIVLPAGAVPGPATLEAIRARLGTSPRIGTSSVRRIAQLTRLFPGARYLPIRGNLDTRLRKLDSGDFDAIVLAAAGLRRLGFEARISNAIDTADCVPAPGQGIIALEIRSDDARTRALLAALDDTPTTQALAAEREVVRALGGGCQMPIGAFATVSGDAMTLGAIVTSLDGTRVVRGTASGAATDGLRLGTAVAADLLRQGAAAILAEAAQVPQAGPR
ncbi:MAG: hydroxymethylbilane synthase [Vicinamibacterales bacterium]